MEKTAVSDKLKKNYEHYYDGGDSEWRRIGAVGKADNIIALSSQYPHDTILEIGAGEGSILKRLSELEFGKKYYALDISPSGVETIKKKQIPRLLECNIFDGYDIPYGDSKFDIAVLSHVVEHVEHPRQLLYEASRVAKRVFVEVPLEDSVRAPNNFVFDSVGHINFYSQKTIRKLLQSCNLRVLNEIVTNPPKGAYVYRKGIRGLMSYYVKEALIRVAPRIAMCLFTYHGALLCEKSSSSEKGISVKK
jgi:ubiquinone/menaquinone biosynthesis C-methylase UbiE